MKVLLYYPCVTPTTHFPTWEPLQLIYLAKTLRRNNIEVEIIDGRLFEMERREALVKSKITSDVLCLGITAMTSYQLFDAIDFAEHVNKYNPNLPIVFGGWHATTFPAQTLEEIACVDIVVRGQGERTFLEIVKRMLNDDLVKGIEGISWRKEKKIVHEKDRQIISPEEFPLLQPSDYELLELKNYQIYNVLFYMSSFGCPYGCGYCSVSLKCNRRWIPLSSDRVTREIFGLHKRFGFKEINFWDNIFFVDKQRITNILEDIVNSKINLSWSAYARVNEVKNFDSEFLKLIKRSGCKELWLGVESASQKILDKMNKRFVVSDILPALKKLRDHDINVVTNWMVGYPDETHEDILQSITFIKQGLRLYGYNTGKFKIFVNRVVPIPGTKLYNGLDENARVQLPASGVNWAKYIHQRVRDGMEPWKGENGKSLFAPSMFYLVKTYFEDKSPTNFLEKILKMAAKIRVKLKFFRFPFEWWLYKRFCVKRSERAC